MGAADRSRRRSSSGRDIGPPGPCENPKRRDDCRFDLLLFANTYFPDLFYLPHAPDHLASYKTVQRIVLEGGQHAWAEPRGSGKTTRAVIAAIWAILYGHHRFVALVSATADTATNELMEAVKTHFETNPLLAADFPCVCHPIKALEGTARQAPGQHIAGERTCITWEKGRIVLPTLASEYWNGAIDVSGAIIAAAGLLGRIRGMSFTAADGVHRPSLAIVDDPQTDSSAVSVRQCEMREKKIRNAVLGLAGPGKKISLLMPLTVIAPNDLADRLLDREKYPDFQGVRVEALKAWPKRMDLWKKYAEVRSESLRMERGSAVSTDWYRERKEEMDEGSVTYWPERFNPDEISSIQNLLNLYFEDEGRFFSEMQNRPKDPMKMEGALSADQIAAKVHNVARMVVPLNAAHLVAFIDCHADLLYYAVGAISAEMTGHIVDYGAFPDQKRTFWTLRDANPTMQSIAPGTGPEAALLGGLTALTNDILSREWRTEGGATMRISRCLIDAGWATDDVHDFSRRSAFAPIILPSMGRPFGPTDTPLASYQQKAGDQVGLHWRVNAPQNARRGRSVTVDTNFWKSFVCNRLRTPTGDKGAWTLFEAAPRQHRLVAEHLTSEFVANMGDQQRKVDLWKLKPNRDNHFYDCFVGLAVAASIQGASLAGPAQAKGRVKWSDVQREKARRRTG
jgi:hypothetical protein